MTEQLKDARTHPNYPGILFRKPIKNTFILVRTKEAIIVGPDADSQEMLERRLALISSMFRGVREIKIVPVHEVSPSRPDEAIQESQQNDPVTSS